MFRFRHVEVKNGEPVAAFESDNFVSFMNLTKLISSFTKKEDEETIQEYRLAICGIINATTVQVTDEGAVQSFGAKGETWLVTHG